MPTNILRGDAPAQAKVYHLTPANVEIGDIFTVTINGKSVSYTAAAATATDVINGLVAAINASTIPEFGEITAAAVDSDSDGVSDYLTVTASTAGVEVVLTTSTTNSSGGNVSVVETVAGVEGVNERQKIELIGSYSGGTFTITWDAGSGDETTGNIAHNASAATIQAALEALTTPTAGDFVVTGSAGGPWYVTFQGTYAETNVNLMSVDGTNLTGGGSVDVETTTPGAASSNEVQYLLVQELPSQTISGTYTLTFDGETTSSLAYDASAATIQSALEALGTIGSGNISVTGGQGVPWAGGDFDDNWYFTLEFIGALAGTNVSTITADDSGLTVGSGQVTVTALLTGGVSTTELQLINLDTPTAGAYTLSYDGQTTGSLAYNAIPTTIETALEALSNLSNVQIKGNAGIFTVRFDSDAGTNVAAITINSAGLTDAASPSVTTIVEGASASGTDEVQTVTIYGTGGTFTLTFDGQTTAATAWNASAGTLETNLEALSNITDVTVTGSGTPADPYVVTFDDPGSQNVVEMTGDASSLTGGGGQVTTITNAVASADEQQTVTIGVAVTGGTFTLSFQEEETAAIAYNAAASAVETALESLSTIDGVTVSGSAGGPWTVTFDSALHSATNVELLVADGTNLIGGAGTETLSYTVNAVSLGQEHWNDPKNWTLGQVPETGDDVILEQGATNLRYGLRQIQEFTADNTTNTFTTTEEHYFVDDQKVRVSNSGGALPTGLSAATDYYITAATAFTFQLSTTRGGSALSITTDGTGTHTVAVELGSLKQYSRYTGQIGLRQRNENDYREYRPRWLKIGLLSTGNKKVKLGLGEGSGSGLVRLDFDTYQVDGFLQDSSGGLETEVPAVLIENTNSSSVWDIQDGEVGFAFHAGTTGELGTLTERGGSVVLGDGMIVSTALVRTSGELLSIGEVTINGTVEISG